MCQCEAGISLNMLKKSFESWKIYATRKCDRRRSICKADYMYNTRLKQRSINSLRNLVATKKTRSHYAIPLMRHFDESPEVKAAQCLWRKRMLKKSFIAWSAYVKSRHRKQYLNIKVSDLVNELIINKYIKIWKEVLLEKKRNYELDNKAYDFFRRSLLRKLLKLWIGGYNERVVENMNWQQAILHYHQGLLIKSLLGWRKYCKVKVHKGKLIVMALEFYERKLFRKYIQILATNASKRIAERTTIQAAINGYLNKILRKAFYAWIEFHKRKIEKRSKIETLCSKIEIISKRKHLRLWRVYVWKEKCKRRQFYSSMNHYKCKLATKAINALQNYLMYRKTKIHSLLYLKNGMNEISMHAQHFYLNKWRTAVILLARDRQKFNSANEYWCARLKKRCFTIWKIFSEQHKLKTQRKNNLIEIGKSAFLIKYVTRWFSKYESIRELRKIEIRAASVYESKLKSRLFVSWMRYAGERVKKKKEISEALKYHEKMLIEEGLTDKYKKSLFKNQFPNESRFKKLKKTSTDDLAIIKRFFDKWLHFVYTNSNGTSRIVRSTNKRKKAYNIQGKTRGFVIPEYMRKNTVESHYCCQIYGVNCLSDKFAFSDPSFLDREQFYKNI